MFNIPEWESDTPSPKLSFSKKAINIRNGNKNEMVKLENDEKKEIVKMKNHKKKEVVISSITPHIKTEESKTHNNNNIVPHQSAKPSRKQESDRGNIDNDMQIDEMLLDATNRKFMNDFQKIDREDLLFSESNTKKRKVVRAKKVKKQLIQKAKPEPISNSITNDVRKPQKRKMVNNKTNPEETQSQPSPKVNKFDLPEKEGVTSFHQNRNTEWKKRKFKSLLENNQRRTINTSSKSEKLRQRMLERFKAAQFRYLNEKLYTSSGDEAKEIFQSDPGAFQTYHQGYQQQVKKWPVNPLDIIVQKIHKMPKSYIIADMGCGEAALSRRVNQTVKSFDLVATNTDVTACDIAHTPLAAAAVDVAVYCLALMGADLTPYLLEANRVLKMGGQLLIAEVESRFDDVNTFISDVKKLGFKLKSLDNKHSVFYFLHFEKIGNPVKKGKPSIQLKPCLYKRR